VNLTEEDRTKLDRLTEPTLNFPAAFLKNAGTFMHGGSTVNGVTAEPWPMAPKNDAERY